MCLATSASGRRPAGCRWRWSGPIGRRRHPALPLRRLRRRAPGRPGSALERYRAAEGGRLPGLRGHRAAADGTARGRGAAGGRAMTHTGAASAGAAGFQIRPAREADLDVIAWFEIEIARASFGSEAIEDPALHRKRVAGALGKPG